MRISRATLIVLVSASPIFAAPPCLPQLSRDFNQSVLPFLTGYCINCHGEAKPEAELDLSSFTSLASVQVDLDRWELVLTRLKAGEMPPKDAPQRPCDKQRQVIVQWIEGLRMYEAHQNAGDPGPVLARRLNNAEYDYTIRDLTGVDIRPTSKFPVDPANEAGFTNSGESLSMSPTLLSKYLEAAQHVANHLVLMPTGFAFSSHPAITYSDRDKFAVRRIVDFYLALNLDYADFLLTAWKWKHRDLLDRPEMTLADAAASMDVSAKYLATLWQLLDDEENNYGPIAELRQQWNKLPVPQDKAVALPTAKCQAIRDRLLATREKWEFPFPPNLIGQLPPTTQPGVLWKNRLIASQRQQAHMSDEEKQDENLKLAIERFCSVFPDMFVMTERGRMHLPYEKQNKGRLLGAGFHLQVGYYRDDAPLYDMVLTDVQKIELDEMWQELYFVTDVLVRQFQDFVFFHRTEGRDILTKEEFDFARQDRAATSQESMEKFARLYVAAVRGRNVSEQGLAEIAKYFVDMSRKIQHFEKEHQNARPGHLKALVQFAEKAWRRPLSQHERESLRDDYRDLRESGKLGHEEAIRDVVVSVLVSPNFCYRIDFAEPTSHGTRLTSLALANRLSYFLWCSMPDEELMRIARTGSLQKPEVLLGQALRMLKDDRVQALAIEFGGNWLNFRQFQQHVGVDRTKFVQFTDPLRESMYLEPVHFITGLIQQDGSVMELLTAKHTYVNEHLAVHYEIPYVDEKADENGWIRVENAHEYGRGGILPMSVFLTTNSPGLRTSPVKRGYWVVKRVLGERIPAPPADVPGIPEDESDLGDLTLREVMKKHREVESCAICHNKFDFAGLVFEGYGPIGERRTRDLSGKTINSSTLYPDGTQGEGLVSLRQYMLKQQQNQFHDNLCRKLLAFALGRTLLLSDEPTIIRMKESLIEHDQRFSSLVKVIVASRPFLNKRDRETRVHDQN